MDQHPSVNNLYLSDRLQKTLAGIGSHTVTTVIAPMGYGKSTALKWWQQQLAARIPHAQVFRQLVAADSRQDFWDGFCRALRSRPCSPGSCRHSASRLTRIPCACCTSCCRTRLAGHPDPVFFILDDVHLLQSVDLPGIVSFLAERLPPQVHIVLLSRNQIFSAAAQLRLGSGLLTIGAADLRLRPEEICRYAACCRLPMTLSQAQALFAVSEGWRAMLYLMFRAYCQTGVWQPDSRSADTLIEQVMLDPLDERRRLFLLKNCLTEEFTAEQACFVWQEADGEALLHDLTHNNAFITTGDAGVYRCHHMLRMLLRRKFALLDEARSSRSAAGSAVVQPGGRGAAGRGVFLPRRRLGRRPDRCGARLRKIHLRRAPADAVKLVPIVPGGGAPAAPGRALRADAQALFLPADPGAAAAAEASA